MTDNNTSPSNSNAGTNRNQAALDEHDNAHYDKGDSKSDLSSSKHSLTAVLEQLEPNEDADKISIGDIMDSLNSKGFGPLIFAPALIAIMPTGGIPGVPTICGVIITLISVQMLFGKERPWLPQFVDNISFDEDKLHKGVNIASKATKWIDKLVKPRLKSLTSDKAKKVAAALCIFAALAMIPLELVPFAVMIPAASVILFAISLITEDGYVFLAGLLLNLATIYFLITQVL
ncbi:exopolysaccharide biosynthesis protein [uncultured Psychrobacter sp.]|uniref:exopolysaccharide biosynthesis protein n=1 Tax=uncultured Psychrobacter sp. TaxID=259303 RepID=UPI00261621C1|nr:exopolysaccharide biosynthesis protein [uncultured Psychrobacter sp.]